MSDSASDECTTTITDNVHLIACYCVASSFYRFWLMIVNFGICRQQNIKVLMCCGIILLDVHFIAAEEKTI